MQQLKIAWNNILSISQQPVDQNQNRQQAVAQLKSPQQFKYYLPTVKDIEVELKNVNIYDCDDDSNTEGVR